MAEGEVRTTSFRVIYPLDQSHGYQGGDLITIDEEHLPVRFPIGTKVTFSAGDTTSEQESEEGNAIKEGCTKFQAGSSNDGTVIENESVEESANNDGFNNENESDAESAINGGCTATNVQVGTNNKATISEEVSGQDGRKDGNSRFEDDFADTGKGRKCHGVGGRI